MILNDLLGNINIKKIFGKTDIDIKGLSYDSRKTEKDYIFFALNGVHNNGLEFIPQAISKGAICVISEQEIVDCKCTNIVVENVMETMSKVSAVFYDYPDKKLTVIGVTGTNGKTSVTYMTESVFKNLNIDTLSRTTTIPNAIDKILLVHIKLIRYRQPNAIPIIGPAIIFLLVKL